MYIGTLSQANIERHSRSNLVEVDPIKYLSASPKWRSKKGGSGQQLMFRYL